MIVAHTNESEYRAFISNKKNEALQSRMIVMPVPYNLRVDDEVKIYEKLIKQSDLKDVHISPHALKTAAIFSVLTRLKQPKKQGVDLLKKLYLYNGQSVEGLKDTDVKELRHEYPDEGMSGLDPRYVINRISTALIRRDTTCINALDVLRAMKDGLDQHAAISKEDKERLLNLVAVARKEYDEMARPRCRKRSCTRTRNPRRHCSRTTSTTWKRTAAGRS